MRCRAAKPRDLWLAFDYLRFAGSTDVESIMLQFLACRFLYMWRPGDYEKQESDWLLLNNRSCNDSQQTGG